VDYFFIDTLFHAIDYNQEWGIISLGTNKGSIMQFKIVVAPK
jgi:hypothetical protein